MRRSGTALIAASVAALALTSTASAGTRSVSFSGYKWAVKASTERIGPGPNIFSSSTRNVFVDRYGRLHLRLTRSRPGSNVWHSAEVIGKTSLGYGTYTWAIDSPVHALDPNAVFGMFTYSHLRAYHHREMDVEFSRWGKLSATKNALHTVQPSYVASNMHEYRHPPVSRSVHSFTWTPSGITFRNSALPALPWAYTGPSVPPAGGERPRMNLWLFRGKAPTTNYRKSVIIRKFTFTPLPTVD